MPAVDPTSAIDGTALRQPLFSRRTSPWDNEKPIREELFSVERLEAHARSLAVAQNVAGKPNRGLPLSARLADNGAVLLSAYRSIVAAIDDGHAITPAAEWLIDNYHLVEKQIRQIAADLPPGYYRQLPKLVTGPFAGYPRVFGMAWAFVAHTDSCFDSEILVAYINAYQEVQPLTIGELWAVSITLQIVLIENLRRLAQQITLSRAVRREADGLADRLLGVGRTRPGAGVESSSPAVPRRPLPRGVRGPTRASAARSRSEVHAGAGLARRASGETGHDRGFGGARGPSQPGRGERDRSQHRHQPARDRRGRLEGIVRTLLPRRRRTGRRAASFWRWISRPARSTAARSRNWRAARVTASSTSRVSPSRPRSAPHPELALTEQSRRADAGYHLLAGGRRSFEASIGFRRFRIWPARVTATLNFDAYAASIVAVSLIVDLRQRPDVLSRMGVGSLRTRVLALLGAISAIDVAVALVNRVVTLFVRAVALPALALRTAFPNRCARSSPCRRF